MLTFLTFFPLAGVLLLLLLKAFKKDSDNVVKGIAIGTSALTFLISAALLLQFKTDNPNLQFVEQASWIPSWGIQYYLGVDGISILMVMLTTIISLLAVIASWSAIKEQKLMYYVLMLLLQVGMMGVFLAQDLFLFYIFWEFTLIPMYFLIGIWGGQRRVYAAIK
ncbi:MAG TPA: Fe-S-binding domain-containing protein, partial [Anaerolineae bacterium]|nr:Fe-S-binding domain-containing protein [Anaerolineae bacterium]